MRLRSATCLSTALLLATALPLLAEGLDARLTATRVAEGDQVTLTLSADAAAGAGQPDLSVLDADFTVLSTASGSQTTIVNGARSDTRTWQITLAPRRSGALTVPPITAGSVSSAPLTLTVLDAAELPPEVQAGRPSLLVAPPEGTIYAQQEVPLTVQLRLPPGTQGAEIVPPSGSGFLLEQSGDDRITRQADGSVLVERTYLLRPQAAGTLTIPGFALQARIADPDAPEPMAGFGRAPFGNLFGGSRFGGMFAPTRSVTVTGESLVLSVAETPGGSTGWVLPASRVELAEVWQPDPPVFRVGEAVTRKVQVLALGAHGEQIPDLAMPDLPGARIYFEGSETRSVPTAQGTAALREFTWSIVPTSGGTLTLPEVSLEWFDTVQEVPATATLAARSFEVEGPVAAAPTPPAMAPEVPGVAAAAEPPNGGASAALPTLLALVGLGAAGALGFVLARTARGRRARPVAAPPPTRDALLRAR
ncbi:BatD family protein, partial [Roseibacterium sp. SDUM158016]|uniref:BatD family protein n=1 Tax=Roseicyclus sediminis TaxID=2980997 RepID=UPI0021D3634C